MCGINGIFFYEKSQIGASIHSKIEVIKMTSILEYSATILRLRMNYKNL